MAAHTVVLNKLYSSNAYLEDLHYVVNQDLPWEKLKGKCVVLSGVSGMIGSFLVDVLLEANRLLGINCSIYGIGRNEDKAKKRFGVQFFSPFFHFIACDLNDVLNNGFFSAQEHADIVIHLASNTHPVQYAQNPVDTICTNIIGTKNMLDLATTHRAEQFVFASSVEVYGENRGDTERFSEEYCGYINCNTVRAGYPESKRCGEALCQAYRHQAGISVVIPRLARIYGPTLLMDDTKAISQFIKKGLAGENIVLKSAGTQYYSFLYVMDAVSALLTITLMGENGEAYNTADESSDIRLKDLAEYTAKLAHTSVIYEKPNQLEAAGYSNAMIARMSGEKLKALGWHPKYTIQQGLERTMQILKDTLQSSNDEE